MLGGERVEYARTGFNAGSCKVTLLLSKICWSGSEILQLHTICSWTQFSTFLLQHLQNSNCSC